MAVVMKNGSMLEHINDDFKNDKVVVMAALSNGGDFSESSQRLQKDPRMIDFAIEHGHVPTKEQLVLLSREKSSMSLHKSDAELEPFNQFARGVHKNLEKRFEYRGKIAKDDSKIGILNELGPDFSRKTMRRISDFVSKPMDRGSFPANDPMGGTRRKRTKRR